MRYYIYVITFVLFLLTEHALSHKILKRSYLKNNYDLDGSGVTQTLRFTRDTSNASVQEPRTCSTWGQGAFKTFTDDFYYFTSNCSYILSRQCQGDQEDFNVEILRDSHGNLEHIFMKIEDSSIVVANGEIKVKNEVVSLPYNDKLIDIQQYGTEVRFSNKKRTVSVTWNYNDALSITVDVQYQGKLCGLCGPFDESVSTIYDYQHTLQANLDAQNSCTTVFPEETTCESTKVCSEIPKHFKSCSSEVINNRLMKMCQMSVCACRGAPRCHCASFERAARQCVHVNPPMWNTWRDTYNCTRPSCPGNQVFQECGPACMPTCTDPNSQQQCDQCINTCGCKAGLVLDNLRGGNRCIRQEDCPCEYNGEIYSTGKIRNSLCQSCICKGGMWDCIDLNCPGTCKIEEGTHITTFDGTYYNLIGDCSYYAVVTKDWSVKIEMHPCNAAYEQTCLQRVTYTIHQNIYTINNDGTVQHNGNTMELPLGNGNIMIFEQSSHYIQMHAKSGLKMQIQISPIMQLYISLPKSARGSTKGLCGTFNDNAEDDFLSAQNIVEHTFIPFSDSWKDNEICPLPKLNPVCVSSENENFAKEHCAYLKDPTGDFSRCHAMVEFDRYYEMCKAASCHCKNVNDCVCAALGAYARACASKGITVKNWRRSVCRVSCPSTQIYHHNMRACNRTCQFLSSPDFTCELQDVPVDGCGCAEGLYMNDKKECVSRPQCPCYVNGMIIPQRGVISLNGMECFCLNGVPSCPNRNKTVILKDCKSQNKIFSDCEIADVCKRTCETLNKPCSKPCVPGCVCPKGLVEDSSGRCIAPSQCPCLFGGEKFFPGETIKSDCNTCNCKGGTWICTNDPCPKTCHVYGDGHYITFDGKRYSFDGNCEYIFVEDQCLRDSGTFQILTESVSCCEKGVTCSRNIRILFEEKEIILLSESGVSEVSLRNNQCTDKSYTFHTVGLYLVLTFSNGITVIWDKRTRFSVTLDPRWKNKVCGLCGNFNDELEDDLSTKGNSLMTNFVEFGNSWKSMRSCSNSLSRTFPCENNPYCLAWAQKRCSIITGPIFQACHKMVDPTPYYEACVQEACACDMEGKYLGLCTAIAVYAEACNKANVCIRWRNPDLCPVFCEYYNTPDGCIWHYQPCGTVATKTCSSHFVGKKYSAVLEGCYAKCPDNAPYLDENTMKCVTLPRCTCYYEGRILQPGEITMNDCEECVCHNGITTCRQITTTTATTTTESMTSSTIEETTTTVTPTTTTSTTEETTTPTSTTTTESTTTSTREETTTTVTPSTTTSTTEETTTPTTTESTTTSTTEETTTTVTPSTTTSTTEETTTPTTTESTTTSTTEETTTTVTPTTTTSTTEETTTPTTTTTTESTTTSTTAETSTTVTPSTTTSTTEETTTPTTTESTTTSTTAETSTTVTPSTTTSTTEETTTPTTTESTTTSTTAETSTTVTPSTTTSTTEETTTPTTTESTTTSTTAETSTTVTPSTTTSTTEETTTPTTTESTTTSTTAETSTTVTPSTTTSTTEETTTPTTTESTTTSTTAETSTTVTPSTTTSTTEETTTPTTTESTTTSTTAETSTTVTPSTTTSTTEETTTPTTTESTTTSTTAETSTTVTPSTTTSTTEETTTPTTTESTTTSTTAETSTTVTPSTTTSTTEETTTPTTTESTTTSTTAETTTTVTPSTTTSTTEETTTPTTTESTTTSTTAETSTTVTPSTTTSTTEETTTPTTTESTTTSTTAETSTTVTPSTTTSTTEETTTPTTTESTTTSTTAETTTTVTPSTTTSTTEETTTPTTTESTTTSTTAETSTTVTPSTTTSTTEETTTPTTTESTTTSTTAETSTTVTPSTTTSTTEETTTPTTTESTTTSTTAETSTTVTPSTTTSTTEETTTPTTTESTTTSTTAETSTTVTPSTTTSTTEETTTPTTTESTTTSTTAETSTTVTPSTTTSTTEETTTPTTTESTTTSTTAETSTTVTPSTTTSTTEETTTPTTTESTTTSTTAETTTTVTPSTTTSTTEETTTPTTTESTTTSTTEETTTTVTPTTTTSTTEETTTPTSTTTTESTTTSTTEPYCPGVWSSWINKNTPSPLNPNDYELLTSEGKQLCPSSYKITNIQCQFANKSDWPLSLSSNVVTCNTDIGLMCRVSGKTVGDLCNDYRIRVCCEPTEETTTVPTTTASEECFCDTNPPRKCNETWKENCATHTCVKDVMFKIEHVACEMPLKPKCYNGLRPVRVKTEDGCCSAWDCEYDCHVWGGRHYRTFDGIFYNFFENCAHILVQEIVPKYNFTVILDNYYCTSSMPKSCRRTLIIHYGGNVIHLLSGYQPSVLFNRIPVSFPYDAEGVNISRMGFNVRINFPDIRTTITGRKHHFRIQVPEQYFLDNTQGQCGYISKNKNDDCRRRDGKVEPPNCCHKTAFDWKIDDPNKPQCRTAPTNVPCTPPPPPPSCKRAAVCDVLKEELFSTCSNNMYFDYYYKACQFDNCEMNGRENCSSQEDGSCESGSRSTEDSDSKEQMGSSSKEQMGSGSKEQMGSGSKEQKGSGSKEQMGSSSKEQKGSDSKEQKGSGSKEQMGSGSKEQMGSGSKEKSGSGSKEKSGSGSSEVDCEGDNCKSNTPKIDCSSLEAAAEMCRRAGSCIDWRTSTKGLCDHVCPNGFIYKACSSHNHNYCKNNMMILGEEFDTPTEGCFCPDGMMLSEDETQCVPSCIRCKDFSGRLRNEGETWVRPNNTCVHFTCTKGVVVETKITCSSQSSCDEASKVWDEFHCCFKCPLEVQRCAVQPKRIKLTKGVCSAFVEVNSCEGFCRSFSIFNSMKNGMMHKCECCQENEVEEKETTLNCRNGKTMKYKYSSAKTCTCKLCKDKAVFAKL
ncbi:uncharacterized protein [Hemitrygon akajei]|uniref:uncharacterized protein n=1 Tax=Hemitrygon akajei TaxID=2704970 RepID=UPI003BF9E26F